jgi:hypothetical protein
MDTGGIMTWMEPITPIVRTRWQKIKYWLWYNLYYKWDNKYRWWKVKKKPPKWYFLAQGKERKLWSVN